MSALIADLSLAALVATLLTAAVGFAIGCWMGSCRLRELARRSRHDLDEAHARLHHIATHDPLTGLPNRNLLKERLAHALTLCHHGGRTIALAAIDLDRFSAVNHSFGHGVGDGVLAEIAHRLEATLWRTHTHTLARIGAIALPCSSRVCPRAWKRRP